MADEKQADASTPVQGAVLFDLESAAINGHEVSYTAAARLFESKGITLSVGTFSQHCLLSSPSRYVENLLALHDKARVSEDKLVADLDAALDAAFVSNGVELAPLAADIIAAARSREMAIGFVTGFALAKAEAVLEKVGLKDVGPIVTRQGVEGRASTEQWRRAARAVAEHPRLVLAVTSEAGACKAALASRMHCVAVPNRFTGFQDFGGADLLVEQDHVPPVDDMLGLLFTHLG